MKIAEGLIEFAESILYLKVEGVDSFQDVVDFFFIVVFPFGEDLGKLLQVSHYIEAGYVAIYKS